MQNQAPEVISNRRESAPVLHWEFILKSLALSAIFFYSIPNLSSIWAFVSKLETKGFFKNIDLPAIAISAKFTGLPQVVYAIVVGLVYYAVATSYCHKHHREASLRRSPYKEKKFLNKSLFLDIQYFIIFSFSKTYIIISLILTFDLQAVADNLLEQVGNLLGEIQGQSNEALLALLAIAGILLLDFYAFLIHYVAHNVGFIWDWHELHHSAEKMNFFNEHRKTPFEVIVQAICFSPILALAIMLTKAASLTFIGLIAYLLFNSIKGIHGILSHAPVPLLLPWPLSAVFMDPGLHHIHHSDKPEHFGKNLGSIFVFWDKLFGTYLDASHIANVHSYGVANSSYTFSSPLRALLIIPYFKIFARLNKIMQRKRV